jgi:MtN3 and saliva related transmembrane protein
MTFTDGLGYFAGAVTSITFLPQVIKTWKQKSARDISLLMFIVASSNNALWIWYGIREQNPVIILTNAVVLTMALIMIYFKLRYK